jgi:pyruvate dehydrogenase E2 component (dihydrolipoamide acetyltransferase)
MPTEVILPRVDMDMETAKVSRWFVEDGAPVKRGEPIFEIETAKAAMEIEAPADGRIGLVGVATDMELPVGSTVAWIYSPGEAVVVPAAAPTPAAAPEPTVVALPGSADAPAPADVKFAQPAPAHPGELRATPLARTLARRFGLDLAGIAGSGPRGRILSADVEARAAAAPSALGLAGEAPLHHVFKGLATGRPIALIHGFAADLTGFHALTLALEKQARLLLIDLPGHGGSIDVPADSAEAMADALAGTIARVAPEGVHVVAHSLGGAIGALLAERRPDLVASLTLIAPAGMGPEINAAFIEGMNRATGADGLRPWLRELFADPETVTPAYASAAWRSRADAQLRAAQARIAAQIFPDGAQALDIRAKLAALTCPTRIIWGRRDRIVPARHADAAPDAVALNRLADIGHMPHVEATSLVARLVMQTVRSAA